MKKIKKVLIGGLGCCLLFIYGLYFKENYQQLQQKRFNEAEEQLVDQIYLDLDFKPEHFRLVTKKYNKLELMLIIPENAQGEVIADVNEAMNQLAEDIAKKKPQDKDAKIAISATSKQIQKNLTQYTYNQSVYHWEEWQDTWKQTSTALTTNTIINKLTGKKLTLGDLFQNQQNLSTINQIIQHDLLAAASQPQTAVDDILALPLLLTNETNFDYGTSKVKIKYPGKNHYLSEYILDFKNVGEFLNPDFVAEKYIQIAEEPPAKESGKMIALTFDDGPNDTTTEKVLATLTKEKVPATFFMLGEQVISFPEMAKKIADAGHELANHSYSHPDLASLNTTEVRQEINKTQSAIYQATGVLPTYVRPPYGSFTYETAVAIGQPLVNWDVDTLDWKDDDVKLMVKRIENQLDNESIILMHDIQQTTVDALPKVIELLKKQDYQFVTISELLQKSTTSLTIHYSGNNHSDITKKTN